MKKLWKKVQCFGLDHKAYFVERSDDWLNGGTYHWHCLRCDKRWTTHPYLGK